MSATSSVAAARSTAGGANDYGPQRGKPATEGLTQRREGAKESPRRQEPPCHDEKWLGSADESDRRSFYFEDASHATPQSTEHSTFLLGALAPFRETFPVLAAAIEVNRCESAVASRSRRQTHGSGTFAVHRVAKKAGTKSSNPSSFRSSFVSSCLRGLLVFRRFVFGIPLRIGFSKQERASSNSPPAYAGGSRRAFASSRRHSAARATVSLLAVLAALFCGGEAVAQDFTLRGHDLEVHVNSKWAGNAFGGYWPVRIRAVNKRPARTVTFRIPGNDGVPSVQRTVALEQNAAARFTLLVPMVGQGTHAEFQVIENGRPLKGMSGGISLPAPDVTENPRPALVVISSKGKDFAPFEQAVTQIVATGRGGSGGSSYGYHGHGYGHAFGPSRTEDHQTVDPGQLPDSWLAYSGVDIVAVPLDVLAGLSPEERRPMLAWVRTGGTLLVFGLTPAAAERARLDALLNLGGQGFADGEWTDADASRQAIGRPAPAEVLIDPFSGAAIESIEFGSVTWSSDAFSQRSLMLGRVIAFRGDPFPGQPADWAWLLQSIGKDHYSWTERNGVHARIPAGDFLAFSIPGVAGVPIYAFLLLITVFTIVIGPVNYVVCRRKNRMSLLVVTIPAIAFFTSLALFGYSAIAHGFGVDSRTRSVTYLDQPARTAVTHGRVAYFAGMSPSGGLRFLPETAVHPVWPELNEDRGPFEGGMVDWTATQAWTAGWLKSRTRTQFRTVTHRDARERIEFAPASEGGLDVTNGLKWNLSLLIVTDAKGNTFALRDLDAGNGKRAVVAENDDWAQVRAALNDDATADPRHGAFRSSVDPQTFVRNMLSGHDAVNFVSRLSTGPGGGEDGPRPFPPNSYFAILNDNPGLDTGVPSARERVGLHLLIGRY